MNKSELEIEEDKTQKEVIEQSDVDFSVHDEVDEEVVFEGDVKDQGKKGDASPTKNEIKVSKTGRNSFTGSAQAL